MLFSTLTLKAAAGIKSKLAFIHANEIYTKHISEVGTTCLN